MLGSRADLAPGARGLAAVPGRACRIGLTAPLRRLRSMFLSLGLAILTLVGVVPAPGPSLHAQTPAQRGRAAVADTALGRPCPDRPAIPALAALQCFVTSNGYGWIFAPTPRQATYGLRLITDRAPKFERYFGRRLPRGIWFGKGSNINIADTVLVAALRAAGSTWEYGDSDDFLSGNADLSFDVDAHEVGHLWFFATVAPAVLGVKGYKGPYEYGSRLPDWLDEAAALSMEEGEAGRQHDDWFDMLAFSGSTLASAEQSTRQPRVTTASSWERNMAVEIAEMEKRHTFVGGAPLKRGPAAQLLPLDSIFRVRHPMNTSLGLNNVVWLQVYGQVSGVLDFLAATTGDLKVLGSIADGLLKDSTMAQWLQGHGAEYNLAGTMPGLEKQWQAWIRQHHRNKKQAFDERAAKAAKP